MFQAANTFPYQNMTASDVMGSKPYRDFRMEAMDLAIKAVAAGLQPAGSTSTLLGLAREIEIYLRGA